MPTILDLAGVDTSAMRSMDNMFRGCIWLKSVNLSGWDTTHVVDMSRMFSYCKNLTEIYFNGWSTPNLQYTYSAFADCHSLKKLDLSGLYTGNVTDMSSMFSDCYSLESLLINKWNTSHAIEMDYMFYDCYALKSLNVSSFNTSKVTTMSHMFSHCETLKSLNLGSFNTSNVIDMTSMFAGCYNIKSLDLRSFSTGRTKYMDYMFESCHSLEDVNLRSFRTPSLQRVDGMFGYCYVLKTVDLSKFDFGNVSYSSYYSSLKGRLFYECEDLMIVQAPLHLRESYKVEGDNWYRDDKNTLITEIPMKLNTSVVLHKQEEKNKFVDVRLDGWQYKSVKQIVDLKYMSGKGTTKDDNALIVFDANTPMTRAEFVQVLYNHAGRPSPKKKANFKDVDAKQWYANAVYWAYENKVVSGKGNNLFGVNDKITRQDMVTILYNYAGKINKKSISDASKYNLNEFTDKKDVATYAKLPLQWATGHKIMNGKITQKTKLKLSPKGNATRAEGATVICNFVTYLSKLK